MSWYESHAAPMEWERPLSAAIRSDKVFGLGFSTIKGKSESFQPVHVWEHERLAWMDILAQDGQIPCVSLLYAVDGAFEKPEKNVKLEVRQCWV